MFQDRRHAGIELGRRLAEMAWHDPVVFGLARGGVPVAAAVADALDAPLDVAVARKIGAPAQPELGVGAVCPDGSAQFDRGTLAALGLDADDLRDARGREHLEARARQRRYREGRQPMPVTGREVILVDDGLATGVTARAALRQLRAAEASRLVFATPVCAKEAETALRASAIADEVVCLRSPTDFGAVGAWYEDFGQTSDDEVARVLAGARLGDTFPRQ